MIRILQLSWKKKSVEKKTELQNELNSWLFGIENTERARRLKKTCATLY